MEVGVGRSITQLGSHRKLVAHLGKESRSSSPGCAIAITCLAEGGRDIVDSEQGSERRKTEADPPHWAHLRLPWSFLSPEVQHTSQGTCALIFLFTLS